MPNDIIPRDSNRVTALAGITDDANAFIKALRVDPVTGRLKVSATLIGGSGTVTSVSVVTANGVSGSVATATSTPAITLTLGAITPTSVNSVVISGASTPTLSVTGTSSISGSNTGDQTITLTGDVTGSGTGSFATTISAGAVDIAMLSATGTPSGTTYLRGDNTWATPAGGGGATVALDNLSAVAINASLVLGTSDAFALGSATKQWSDLFLAEGGVINWDNGDVTLTQTGNLLAVAGGDFAINGGTSLRMDNASNNASSYIFNNGASGLNALTITNFSTASLIVSDTTVEINSGSTTTVATGDLRVTTAGTNTASVVTVGGSQTLTSKTLTTPTIASFANANHSHADSAGGGTLNASAIGAGTLALARGGTGASLADPNADRIMFWDDSAGAVAWLTAGTGLTITDTTITAGGATKEFFVPYVYSNTGSVAIPYDWDVGDFPTTRLSSTSGIRFVFFVPNDFTSLTSADIVVIPDTTETINYDIATDYGANGQAYNTHSGGATGLTQAVTINVIAELSASSYLTSLAANDYVGLVFNSNTTNIQPLGIRIKYT